MYLVPRASRVIGVWDPLMNELSNGEDMNVKLFCKGDLLYIDRL